MDVDNTTSSPSYPKTRPVILDTAKESYLLSPNIPGNGGGAHTYDIALVLEAELEEEAVTENPAATILPVSSTNLQPVQGAGSTKDVLKMLSVQPSGPDLTNFGLHKSTSENLLLNPLSVPPATNGEGTTLSRPISSIEQTATYSTLMPPPALLSERQQDDAANLLPQVASNALSTTIAKETEPPQATKVLELTSLPEVLPSSRRASLVYGDASKPLLLQTLQRNLGEEMFQFLKEGVKVADGLSEDGTQTNWMVQVRWWKWGPVTTEH